MNPPQRQQPFSDGSPPMHPRMMGPTAASPSSRPNGSIAKEEYEDDEQEVMEEIGKAKMSIDRLDTIHLIHNLPGNPQRSISPSLMAQSLHAPIHNNPGGGDGGYGGAPIESDHELGMSMRVPIGEFDRSVFSCNGEEKKQQVVAVETKQVEDEVAEWDRKTNLTFENVNDPNPPPPPPTTNFFLKPPHEQKEELRRLREEQARRHSPPASLAGADSAFQAACDSAITGNRSAQRHLGGGQQPPPRPPPRQQPPQPQPMVQRRDASIAPPRRNLGSGANEVPLGSPSGMQNHIRNNSGYGPIPIRRNPIPQLMNMRIGGHPGMRAGVGVGGGGGGGRAPREGGPGRKERYMPPEPSINELNDPEQNIQPDMHNKHVFGDVMVELIIIHSLPFVNFADAQFSHEIYHNLQARRFFEPMAVQRSIIPIIQRTKNDLLVCAQTGSGKSAAYLLPIIDQIQRARRDGIIHRRCGGLPFAVIVVPTKELAEQLFNDARSFSKGTGVEAIRSYGEVDMNETVMKMRYSCDILFVAPGRALRHLDNGDFTLDQTRHLILDEADKLLRGDFLPVITHLRNEAPNARMMLFSATIDADCQEEASKMVNDHFLSIRVGDPNHVVDTVKQTFIQTPKWNKSEKVAALLREKAVVQYHPGGKIMYEAEKTIIFVNQRHTSDRLASFLTRKGFFTTSLNGEHTLKQRIESVTQFSRGVYHVLVATDVASRGLNFPNVAHVINYELPSHERDEWTYIHRIGRTGRAGNSGRATSLLDPETGDATLAWHYVEELQNVGQEVPDWLEIIAEQNPVRNYAI